MVFFPPFRSLWIGWEVLFIWAELRLSVIPFGVVQESTGTSRPVGGWLISEGNSWDDLALFHTILHLQPAALDLFLMAKAKSQKASSALDSELSDHHFYHILLTKAKHKTSPDLKDMERDSVSWWERLLRLWIEAGIGELEAFLPTMYQYANFYI